MDTNEQPQKSPVAQREEEILAFWKEKDVFKKSLDKEAPNGEYVFYDGPPFATGLPHYGHILASTIKDAIPRYQTMRGKRVERRWGWDCHGLPIENIVEKDLGISGKKQIEEIGIEKFNTHARSKVLTYVGEWKKTVERMARWVDFDGSYKTMDNSYIESVWWALGELNNKDLIYEGTRVLPYCPRCETPIANSEIAMDNSYKDITDISVYVKFELADEPGTYLLAWTTTPWTLPGNVAIAINKEVQYVKATKDGANYIVAKDLAEKVLKENFEIVDTFAGEKLIGKSYTPVFNYFVDKQMPNKENIWKVWHADFVTVEKGTGIAHEAPAFGEEDMALAQANNIPFIKHVTSNGRFTDDVTDFAGQLVKPKSTPENTTAHQTADIEIIKWLAHNAKLFAKEKIIHSYPHCFRCETPLYYYAIPAWFIKIQNVKEKLLANNEAINWIPGHLKHGRFSNSMEKAPDWNISRNRFWATPLPIWKCKDCNKVEFVSSLDDIKKRTKRNRFLIMRHGQSDGNLSDKVSSIYSNEDHLTDLGKQQAKDSINNLADKNIDIICISDFHRAKETAHIVADIIGYQQEAIIIDERLRELNAGSYEGQTWMDYMSSFPSKEARFTQKVTDGENYTDVKRRVMQFIEEVDQKYEGKTILIVSHGLPIEMMFAGSLGFDIPTAVADKTQGVHYLKNAEIRELPFARYPHNPDFELDFHRPYIDSVTWKCQDDNCGGEAKRITEVIDCWFESGSMPFAQEHYPFANKEKFHDRFPSQFVAEYIAQTRTWFYYMHAISTMLFDKAPFENVVTTGTVLAEDGQKMSKSKNNFPDPWILFNKFGVDSLRLYLLGSPIMKSEDLNFSEKGVDEIYKKIIMRLQNVVSFYEMYAPEGDLQHVEVKNELDHWIMSRLREVATLVTAGMEAYKIDEAVRPFMDFVDDLSTWYLRRSRDRFKGEDENDRKSAIATTRVVLIELSKLLAPFAPFIAEDVYQKVRNSTSRESVHLEDWIEKSLMDMVKEKFKALVGVSDEDIIIQMKEVRRLVSLGLEARSTAGIKVRQPLQKLTIKTEILKDKTQLLDLIKDEVNVKEVVVNSEATIEVELDAHLTPELKAEGDMRDLLRAIQDLRKKANLNPGEEVNLIIHTDDAGKSLVRQFESEIKKTTSIKEIKEGIVEGDRIKAGEIAFGLQIEK